MAFWTAIHHHHQRFSFTAVCKVTLSAKERTFSDDHSNCRLQCAKTRVQGLGRHKAGQEAPLPSLPSSTDESLLYDVDSNTSDRIKNTKEKIHKMLNEDETRDAVLMAIARLKLVMPFFQLMTDVCSSVAC